MAATTPRPRRRRRAVKWGSGGLRPEMTLPVEIYSERRIRGFDEAELARVLNPRAREECALTSLERST